MGVEGGRWGLCWARRGTFRREGATKVSELQKVCQNVDFLVKEIVANNNFNVTYS